MVKLAVSKNGVPIRLTDERWVHISEEHDEISELQSEVLKAIGNPLRIVEGKRENYWRLENWRWANIWSWCIVKSRMTGS